MANPFGESPDLLLLLPPEVIHNQLLKFLANDAQSVIRLGQVNKYWHAKCLENSEESFLLWQKLHWYRWNAPKLMPKIVFQVQQSHADFLPFDGAFEDLKHKYRNEHERDESTFQFLCRLCEELTEATSGTNGSSGHNMAIASEMWRSAVELVGQKTDALGHHDIPALLWAIIRRDDSFGYFFRVEQYVGSKHFWAPKRFLSDCVCLSTVWKSILTERPSAEESLHHVSYRGAPDYAAWLALHLIYASQLDIAARSVHDLFFHREWNERNPHYDFFACLGYLARFRHSPLKILCRSYLNDGSIMANTVHEIVDVTRHRAENDPANEGKFSLLGRALDVFHERFYTSNGDSFDVDKFVAELPFLRCDEHEDAPLMLAAALRLVFHEFGKELDVMVVSADDEGGTDAPILVGSPFLVGSLAEDWFVNLQGLTGAPWQRLDGRAWQRVLGAGGAPTVPLLDVTWRKMLACIARRHMVQLATMTRTDIWHYKECLNFLRRAYGSLTDDIRFGSSVYDSVLHTNDCSPFPEELTIRYDAFGDLIALYRQLVADEVAKMAPFLQ